MDLMYIIMSGLGFMVVDFILNNVYNVYKLTFLTFQYFF